MPSVLPMFLQAQLARVAVRAIRQVVQRRERPNRWQGLVLGAAGGLAGTLAMGAYFRIARSLMSNQPNGQSGNNGSDEQSGSHALDDISLIGKHYLQGESSTETVGRLAYQAFAGHAPAAKETKTTLSQITHWAFGASMGALYGAVRAGAGLPDPLGGAVFGAAVWLGASELALPLLGLTPGPTTQSAREHANYLAGHIAYGVTTAATTQVLRRIL